MYTLTVDDMEDTLRIISEKSMMKLHYEDAVEILHELSDEMIDSMQDMFVELLELGIYDITKSNSEAMSLIEDITDSIINFKAQI